MSALFDEHTLSVYLMIDDLSAYFDFQLFTNAKVLFYYHITVSQLDTLKL